MRSWLPVGRAQNSAEVAPRASGEWGQGAIGKWLDIASANKAAVADEHGLVLAAARSDVLQDRPKERVYVEPIGKGAEGSWLYDIEQHGVG